jgi:hypothetical protein
MPDIKITESADAIDARERREERIYGCTLAILKATIESSLTFKHSGAGMCAMSLMSDAQEEIARNLREDARQTLNRAKWVVATYLTPERS